MFELLRERDKTNLVVIWKPSNETSFSVYTHPDHRFILQSQFSSYIWILSSCVEISPESKPNKMLAVNIRITLDKSIAKTYDHMFRDWLNFNFEINFSLLWNTVLTTDDPKNIGLFGNSTAFNFIVFDVVGILIWFKLKYLSILFTFNHHLFYM